MGVQNIDLNNLNEVTFEGSEVNEIRLQLDGWTSAYQVWKKPVPPQPIITSVSTGNPEYILIEWDAVILNPYRYRVERKKTDTFWEILGYVDGTGDTPGDSKSYTDYDAVVGTNEYRIVAQNSSGTSPASLGVSGWKLGPPRQPTGVVASQHEFADKIVISWDTSGKTDQYNKTDAYTIHRTGSYEAATTFKGLWGGDDTLSNGTLALLSWETIDNGLTTSPYQNTIPASDKGRQFWYVVSAHNQALGNHLTTFDAWYQIASSVPVWSVAAEGRTAYGLWINQHPFSRFRGNYIEGQSLHNGKPFYMKNGSAPRHFIYYEATLDVWYLDWATSSWPAGGEDTNIPPPDDVSNGALGGCTIQDTWGGTGQKDTPDLSWWRSNGVSITGDTTNWDGMDDKCGLSNTLTGTSTFSGWAFEVKTTPGFINGHGQMPTGPQKYKSHSSIAEWNNKLWYIADYPAHPENTLCHNRRVWFYDTGSIFPSNAQGKALFYSAYDRRWKMTTQTWHIPLDERPSSTLFQSEVTFSELPPTNESWTTATGETFYLTIHEQ